MAEQVARTRADVVGMMVTKRKKKVVPDKDKKVPVKPPVVGPQPPTNYIEPPEPGPQPPTHYY